MMDMWTDLPMLGLLAVYWALSVALVRGLERLEPRNLQPADAQPTPAGAAGVSS